MKGKAETSINYDQLRRALGMPSSWKIVEVQQHMDRIFIGVSCAEWPNPDPDAANKPEIKRESVIEGEDKVEFRWSEKPTES